MQYAGSLMEGKLTITSLDLRVDLNTAIFRYHLFGNRDAFVDRNTLIDNGVVLHTAPLLALDSRICSRQCGSGMGEHLEEAELYCWEAFIA